MPDPAAEKRIAERFARWLSQTTGRRYAVSPGANPPDFLVDPEGWLEVSDIYMRNEQAKFLNVSAERHFKFAGPLDETACRLVAKLDEKLGKQSYESIYKERGKGLLLLTCQDFFFDTVNLAQAHQALVSFDPKNDRGFFETAYFEYQVSGGDHTYEIVYPRKA
jgi:hypothetical protein